MEEIAEIGEMVRYNGKIKIGIGTFTSDLMKEVLKPGNFYEVKEVEINYNNEKDNNWYKFKNVENDYWYPCSNFDRDFKTRYNLR